MEYGRLPPLDMIEVWKSGETQEKMGGRFAVD